MRKRLNKNHKTKLCLNTSLAFTKEVFFYGENR